MSCHIDASASSAHTSVDVAKHLGRARKRDMPSAASAGKQRLTGSGNNEVRRMQVVGAEMEHRMGWLSVVQVLANRRH